MTGEHERALAPLFRGTVDHPLAKQGSLKVLGTSGRVEFPGGFIDWEASARSARATVYRQVGKRMECVSRLEFFDVTTVQQSMDRILAVLMRQGVQVSGNRAGSGTETGSENLNKVDVP